MAVLKFIAILVIGVVASGEAHAPKEWCGGPYFWGVAHQCAVAHGTTEADLYDYIHFKWAASEKAKCFRACLFTVCKVFNKDGGFGPDLPKRTAYLTSYRDLSKWSITEKLIEFCIHVVPIYKNRCDTAEALLRCVAANTPVKLSLEALL